MQLENYATKTLLVEGGGVKAPLYVMCGLQPAHVNICEYLKFQRPFYVMQGMQVKNQTEENMIDIKGEKEEEA